MNYNFYFILLPQTFWMIWDFFLIIFYTKINDVETKEEKKLTHTRIDQNIHWIHWLYSIWDPRKNNEIQKKTWKSCLKIAKTLSSFSPFGICMNDIVCWPSSTFIDNILQLYWSVEHEKTTHLMMTTQKQKTANENVCVC